MHRGRSCWAYRLPVLHFHSEILAAYVEAEGGEGALGDAVLHSPLRIERLVDIIGDCPILLPGAGVKMLRTKGAQRSLRIRAWHDNKLDDDTALGAFERDSCIACGRITSPCQLCSMCLLYVHHDCTHRFAKRDSGDDGAEVWDHNAWTGQDEWLLVALQTELAKRIAGDSEAIVFEQEARKFHGVAAGGRAAR